uniref:EMI domain-containing protein n=1 Tax=Panagrolaimus davidi TaxID=227884 RepID=A0A914P874_9BILA
MELGGIFLFILLFSISNSELNGDNICTKEVDKTVYVTKKVNQIVQLVTTQACPDFTRGFRCPVKKTGTKVTYKTVPEIKRVIETFCCEGYYEIDGQCKRKF